METEAAKNFDDDLGYDVEGIKATADEKSTQRRLDKTDFKVIKESGNTNWEADEKEVKYAIELFVGSRVKESEDLLLTKYGRTLLHTHGLGVLSLLKGLMTFDQADIAYAMDSMRNTAEASSYLRKEQSFFSSFSGMMFGSAQKSKIAVIKSMTFLERQVEICHAESYLLKAVLSILTDSNFTTFLKEGIAIRQSYATYKACYKFLAKLYAEGGAAALVEKKIDAVFITGVYLGIGGFNLILSLLPERLLRLFEFIGFSGQLEFGMQCLAIGGAWPLHELIAKPKHATKKQLKQKSAINFYCDEIPQETGCGTRKFMCEIMLHIYHVIIAGLIPVPACNIPIAKRMADRGLSEFPNSFLFLMVSGKISQTQRKLEQSVDQLKRVIHEQKDWRQLAHVCFWEMGISLAADGKYQEAADCFEILLKESEWSKGIYSYIRAVLLYEVDPVKNKAEVADLLQKVPTYMKKIAGKSIPLEKFVARKARKFFLQNERLLYPVLEILYIWNGFDLIPDKRLQILTEDLEKSLADLDKQQEEAKAEDETKDIPYSTFYDDLCLLRFFKGLATRELAFPSADLLVPEEELVAKVISSEQKKGLEYAAKQLEYISLQADEIEYDHWILPFARYELASLHIREGDYVKAKQNYTAALNGGYTEDEAGKQKKKASMETALHIKVHNALMKLKFLKALRGLEVDRSKANLLGGKKESGLESDYESVNPGTSKLNPMDSTDLL